MALLSPQGGETAASTKQRSEGLHCPSPQAQPTAFSPLLCPDNGSGLSRWTHPCSIALSRMPLACTFNLRAVEFPSTRKVETYVSCASLPVPVLPGASPKFSGIKKRGTPISKSRNSKTRQY